MSGPRGYETLGALARERRLRVDELLLQSRTVDPFYCGSPVQRAGAAWFADLWQRFGFTGGVHLRRVHYRIISQRDVPTLPSGERYDNTEPCWQELGKASKWARYLGLVDPRAIVDHRNPPPTLYEPGPFAGLEPWWRADEPQWSLPYISGHLDMQVQLDLPGVEIFGYDEDPADQPYQLEVWVEKSTMNDVIEPLCRELRANLVPSVGTQSISSVIRLLERIARNGKPTRIFYVSDFDPAGDSMPAAVSRQIEFWRSEYAPEADIKLTALALTAEQVAGLRLPRIPIRETDLRKGAFEDRHGEGAVELDALEALYPGELARIVRDAVEPYRDDSIDARLAEDENDAQTMVEQAWERATTQIAGALREIDVEVQRIIAPYSTELRALQARLAKDLAPARRRLDALRADLGECAAVLDQSLTLPERSAPEPEPDVEDDWLFASDRDYFQQAAVYRERKGQVRLDYSLGYTRMCEVCGADISTRSRKARTCSPYCNNKRRLARVKAQVAS